jgi:hypothetical protein
MRRHVALAFVISFSCGRKLHVAPCQWPAFLTAITIATADGSPLSGVWS